jgi:hypothetical protein
MVSVVFWLDAFDFVGVDSHCEVGGDAVFAMAATCFGVASLMVGDACPLGFVFLLGKSTRQAEAANEYVGCSANLFKRQTFGVGDEFVERPALTVIPSASASSIRTNAICGFVRNSMSSGT